LSNWATTEGSPTPLGATWIVPEEAWNFALYSENATAVTLLLYTEQEVMIPVYQYHLDYLNSILKFF
jgi:glycogen operon protein